MKKNLLLELLNIIKNNDDVRNDLEFVFKAKNIKDISTLLTLTDEEVEDILSIDDSKLMISKMYYYLQKDRINEEVRELVKNALSEGKINTYYFLKEMDKIDVSILKECCELVINTSEEFQGELFANVMKNEKYISNENFLDSLKIIIKSGSDTIADNVIELLNHNIFDVKILETIVNAKGEKQSECATRIALDEDVMDREDALDFIQLLATAQEEFQAEYARSVIRKVYCNKNDTIKDVINIIVNTKYDYQAKYAANMASDRDVLGQDDELYLQLIKLVATAEKEYQAKYAKEVAIDMNVLGLEDEQIIKFVTLVANAKNEHNAKNMSSMMESPDVLSINNYMDYINVIADAKEPYQSSQATGVLDYEFIRNEKEGFEVFRLIANAEKAYQAEYASKAIDCYRLQEHKDVVEIIKTIVTAKEEHQANFASQVARTNALYMIKKENALDIIKLIANAREYFQASYGCDVAIDVDVLESDNTLEIVKTIVNTKEEFQARYASDIACALDLIIRNDIVEIVQIFANIEEKYQAKAAFTMLKNNMVNAQPDLARLINVVATTRGEKTIEKVCEMIIEELNLQSDIPTIVEKTCKKTRTVELDEEKNVDNLMNLNYLDVLMDGLNSSKEEEITSSTVVKVKRGKLKSKNK